MTEKEKELQEEVERLRRIVQSQNMKINKEKELQEEVERLRRIVQSQNMKINAAKWAKHLSDRGLLPYCNAPCPED